MAGHKILNFEQLVAISNENKCSEYSEYDSDIDNNDNTKTLMMTISIC